MLICLNDLLACLELTQPRKLLTNFSKNSSYLLPEPLRLDEFLPNYCFLGSNLLTLPPFLRHDFGNVYAAVAQLVEHQLPKLRVASSSLVYRSISKSLKTSKLSSCFQRFVHIIRAGFPSFHPWILPGFN